MGRTFMLCLLIVSSCRSAPVSGNFEVHVGSPVSVQHGDKATLPCWLSPSQSAEDMEVRWYRGRDQFDDPVIRYMAHRESPKASYAGRVSLGIKDPTSGGLRSGDVSLKLVNVTIQDEGEYTCYVSSSQDHGSSTVSFSVTKTGSVPLLSAVWTEDDMVKLSCESEGWYPQPDLLWSVKDKVLPAHNSVYRNGSDGLQSVYSLVLVPVSTEVSCTVGLSDKLNKKSRIILESPQRPPQAESGSSSAGWVAFGILLLIGLAGAGVLYYKMRAKEPQTGGDQAEENERLLSNDTESAPPTPLSDASGHYENIELVDTNNELIIIKGSKLRDAPIQRFPDGDRVTCLTAVRGTPGFSSGQHYWEVSLGVKDLELKKSWWIGVTNQPEISQDPSFSPNSSDGFWFLSSSPNLERTLQFNTGVSFYVQSRPKTVGVYLNYEKGELSFYNVEGKSLIGSWTATFTGEVFPFFNPGKHDAAPMEILHRSKENQSNNCVNDNIQQQE